ncbi:MAG TPA: hypothetical protein VGN16_05430 [Acidobacteriaceae bacterium]
MSAATPAQKPAPTAAAEFVKARSLYYTPTISGLQSLHCDVAFDWKAFLDKASGTTIPEDNAALVYLRSLKLSVDDDLQGGGSLKWTSENQPPADQADSVKQTLSGLAQTWQGFFQAWNQFMNGSMVKVADDKTVVERNEGGYHMYAKDEGTLAEEQFDNAFLLQSIHVNTPQMDVAMKPLFDDTPHGKIIKEIRASYREPVTAPAMTMIMTVQYATVSGFQLPATVQMEVENVAHFDFHVSGCTVKTSSTASKP